MLLATFQHKVALIFILGFFIKWVLHENDRFIQRNQNKIQGLFGAHTVCNKYIITDNVTFQ